MSQVPNTSVLTRSGLSDLLSNVNVARLFAALFVSNVGSWAQKVTIGWIVWDRTGSATWVSALVIAEIIPLLCLSQTAGRIADRSARPRKLLEMTFAAQLAATLVLALAVYLGRISPQVLVVYISVVAGIQAFGVPLTQVVLADSFVRSLLPRISSVNSVTYNLSRFIGPMLAGAFLYVGSVWLAVLVNALTFIAPLILLPRLAPATDDATKNAAKLAGASTQGWGTLLSNPVVGPLFALLACTSLLGRPIIEHVASLSQHWGTSSTTGVTWLTACAGLGALAAGLRLMLQMSDAQRYRALLNSAFGMATISLVLLLPMPFVGACALFAALGFCVVTHGVSTMGLLHLLTDTSVRGSAFALFNIVLRGGLAVGTLTFGLLLDSNATGTAFGATGLIIATVALLIRPVFAQRAAE